MGRGMLNRINLRLLLFVTAMLFMAAASIAIYRLAIERAAMFAPSASGAPAVAAAQQAVLDSFDVTNLVLGVALATGFALILLGLVQLQRTAQLYDQHRRTRAQL